jgi:hypothetical protein
MSAGFVPLSHLSHLVPLVPCVPCVPGTGRWSLPPDRSGRVLTVSSCAEFSRNPGSLTVRRSCPTDHGTGWDSRETAGTSGTDGTAGQMGQRGRWDSGTPHSSLSNLTSDYD